MIWHLWHTWSGMWWQFYASQSRECRPIFFPSLPDTGGHLQHIIEGVKKNTTQSHQISQSALILRSRRFTEQKSQHESGNQVNFRRLIKEQPQEKENRSRLFARSNRPFAKSRPSQLLLLRQAFHSQTTHAYYNNSGRFMTLLGHFWNSGAFIPDRSRQKQESLFRWSIFPAEMKTGWLIKLSLRLARFKMGTPQKRS